MAAVFKSFEASAKFLVVLALVVCLPKDVSAGQSTQLTPQAQSLFRAGAASLRSGDFQGAITTYQKFMDLNKQYGPAYLNLGLAYHSLNQYEQAIPSFTKALALDDHLESAALFLGIDYCKIGLPEKAIDPLQKALALTPGDPDAHLWLGRALIGKGLYKDAAMHLEKAAAAYPQDSGVQYDLVQTYLLLSEQISDNIYRKDPHSYWAHFLLGQAHQVEEMARPEP